MFKKYKYLRNSSGFTVIETLISIILLFIVIAAGIRFYFFSQELITLTSHKKLAAQIANGRLEQIRRSGYSALPDPAAGPSGVTNACPTAIIVGSLTATCSETVVDVDNPVGGTNPDYKSVTVIVGWSEAINFGSRDVQLVTYMAP